MAALISSSSLFFHRIFVRAIILMVLLCDISHLYTIFHDRLHFVRTVSLHCPAATGILNANRFLKMIRDSHYYVRHNN